MAVEPASSPRWPPGVPTRISDYEKPLFSILDETRRSYPDRVYTIFNGATRTFDQVGATADRIANFLASRGIRKGDRAAIFLPNLPHYPEIFFGILKAGAVCVTCNPMYTAVELNYQLRDSGAKALFCMDHDRFYDTAAKALKKSRVNTVVVCRVTSYLPRTRAMLGSLLGKIPRAEKIAPGHLLFDRIVRTADPVPPPMEIRPATDPAMIIYTGGTTGLPKGATLSHANIVSNIRALNEWVRVPHGRGAPPQKLRPGGFHCYLGVLPWYHSFGLTLCMLAACAGGNRLVCIPDPRAGNPPFSDVLRAVQKYKTTLVIAVPTIYVAFNNHPLLDKFDLSSVVCCASGGAPLPQAVAKKFEAKTGAIIFEGYGLSETAPVLTVNPTNSSGRKFGSVGLPLPDTHIKIVDTDSGSKELTQGKDGEIAASGPQVMTGYWKKPRETAAVFRDIEGRRFFLTGDIGHIDADGCLVITDRKKDLILVGGFNCYPREVEEVLYTHPKVANAAVVGIPDPRLGETAKAYVQLMPGVQATQEEILDYCRTKLAGYKRPRSIEFREQLPMSIIGKVLRRVLREEAHKETPQ